jgi:hypothetical protein
VGSIAGAKIASNSSKRAGQQQQQASREALAYQRERDALEDKRYNDRWQDYQRRHAAWEQRNFGGGAKPTGAGASSGGGGLPVSLADLIGAQSSMGAATAQPQGGSLADLAANAGDWSDWRRYL